MQEGDAGQKVCSGSSAGWACSGICVLTMSEVLLSQDGAAGSGVSRLLVECGSGQPAAPSEVTW